LNVNPPGFIIPDMSEENTQNLPDSRSFEERLFARFDALDSRMERMEARMDRIEARLDDLATRVERLEAESERRAVETKPIWERALAEIVALGQRFDVLEQKVDALQEEVAVISRKVRAADNKLGEIASDMLGLRADQKEVRKQVDKLESEHAR
jgi:chromosome segregation ATPase